MAPANLHLGMLFPQIKCMFPLNVHYMKLDSRWPGFIRVTFRFCLCMASHSFVEYLRSLHNMLGPLPGAGNASGKKINPQPTWNLWSSHDNMKWVRSLRKRIEDEWGGQKTKGRILTDIKRLRGTEKRILDGDQKCSEVKREARESDSLGTKRKDSFKDSTVCQREYN